MDFKVTNNSWSGTGWNNNTAQAFSNVLAALLDDNQLFVAAAGNDGRNMDDPLNAKNYPAYLDNDNIISVASTDRNDDKSIFSNWGATSVDLAAPGSSIYSTKPGNTYGYKSGTSMSSPHVTGAIALLWTYKPELTYAEVKAALLNNVDVIDAMEGNSVSGGRLNLNAALNSIIPVNQAPTASIHGPSTGTTGTSISFNGISSSDPEGDSLTFAWNFGDSSASTYVYICRNLHHYTSRT